MNTLEELEYYCQEPEPVGALLLTGEWGCGKTYLIEHELKEKLKNKAFVVRISLFGVSSLGEMHAIVKQAWMNEYFKIKNIDIVTSKAKKGKDVISNLDFLPSWIRGAVSIDWAMFVEVKEKIDDKSVILVFDDLERCRMDSVDVLGAINDYCENQKFHTIIVANQDKMHTTHDSTQIDMEIVYNGEKNSKNGVTEQKKAILKVSMPPKTGPGMISYSEIKEKIVQRTIKYVPDYSVIVPAIIEEMKYDKDEKDERAEYSAFVKKCEGGLLELFAPDRSIKKDNKIAFSVEGSNNVYRKRSDNENKEGKYIERPHNIRSLKCAISDFYRVYKILNENNFLDIDKWFYSFASYVISYRAGIAKGGDAYETIFSDQKVCELYPVFQSQYIFNGVKEWILYGIWNEETIRHEIDAIKDQEKAETPIDIVRTNRIMDIDEEKINEGFPGVLDMAYSGTLTLDEYVKFIVNCRWARTYDFAFSVPIEWKKVQEGISICMNKMLDIQPEGQRLNLFIDEESRKYYTEEEWTAYQMINDFKEGDFLIFNKNQRLYIEEMKKDPFSAFILCQNKRFDVFSEEMAIATAKAFGKMNNADKHRFLDYFKLMWKGISSSYDFKMKESADGFNKLIDLLKEQKEELQGTNKAFAIRHTEALIEIVLQLIEKTKEKYKG